MLCFLLNPACESSVLPCCSGQCRVIITLQLIFSCHHQLTQAQAPLCPATFSSPLLPSDTLISGASSFYWTHSWPNCSGYFRSVEEAAGGLDTAHPLCCPHLFSQVPHWLSSIAAVIPITLAGNQSPGLLWVILHMGTQALAAPHQAAPHSHSRGTESVCRGLGN